MNEQDLYRIIVNKNDRGVFFNSCFILEASASTEHGFKKVRPNDVSLKV